MNRRSLILGGLASLVATPAIVRAASLMQIRGIEVPTYTPFMRSLVQYEVGSGPPIDRLEIVCGAIYCSPEWLNDPLWMLPNAFGTAL